MKNASKFIIGVCLIMVLTQLASADMKQNVNEYRVISQTGQEEIFDIEMMPTTLTLDKNWDLWEWFLNLFGLSKIKEVTINATEICLSTTITIGDYGNTILFEKDGEEQEPLLFEVTPLGSGEYFIKTCYIANPYEDYYLKFGDESIEIIRISGAEHLDKNRSFIADIYEYVNESDNITYTIPDGNFVRVVFEKNLTNENRIDVYLNSFSGFIEVYEQNENILIGFATNLSIGWNYISLNHTGSQDTFDLKSIGNITYDLIIDPPQPPNWDTNMADNPDPVTVGNDINFTATGDDPDNDDYKLMVCSTDNLKKTGPNPYECNAELLCESGYVADLTQASCNYTTDGDDVGDLDAYGFLVDDTERSTETSTSTTTTVEEVSSDYGTININMTLPINESIWIQGDNDLTISVNISCEGDIGKECGNVYVYPRYNLSSGEADTFINVTYEDTPFYYNSPPMLYLYNYDNINISTQDYNPTGITFNNVGTRLYETEFNGDEISQYNCSDAWNLSSCVYSSSISSQGTPYKMRFNDDGTKFYQVDTDNDRIYQFTCSVAWELESCSYDSKYLSTIDTVPTGLWWKPDGLKLLEVGYGYDNVYLWNCSDAWEIDTCTHHYINLSIDEPNLADIYVSNENQYLYITGYNRDKVQQFLCGDVWNLSGCENVYNLTNIDGGVFSMFFSTNTHRLYFSGGSEDLFYQYSIDEPIYQYENLSTTEWVMMNWTLTVSQNVIDGFYYLDVFANSSLGNENVPNVNSSDILIEVNNTIIYGWLNVSIELPENESVWEYGNTNLTINATVRCEGEEGSTCGTVYSLARYNASSASPDTDISISNSEPFYILTESNPQSTELEKGESYMFNWTLNVSHYDLSLNISHYIDVRMNSSYGNANIPENDTEDRLIWINEIGYGILNVSIELPENESVWNYGDTNLTINVSVTCLGGECGTIYAYSRYNLSGLTPDTFLPTTSTEPLFINTGNNPQSIESEEGESYEFNWEVTTIPDETQSVYLDVFFNSSYGNENVSDNDTENILVNLIEFDYGWLNVSIILPENESEWFIGNTNLTINASVTCEDGDCGTVYAYARYNLSGTTPDTNINITEGDLPFYVLNWFNGWDSRRTITIEEQSGNDLSNYSIIFNVPYESEMQSDFDDLRFTELNGTNLSYYIINKTDDIMASIGIMIPSLSSLESKSIYMYYGNDAVSTTGNVSTTFLFGDDASVDRSSEYTTYNVTSLTHNSGLYTITTPSARTFITPTALGNISNAEIIARMTTESSSRSCLAGRWNNSFNANIEAIYYYKECLYVPESLLYLILDEVEIIDSTSKSLSNSFLYYTSMSIYGSNITSILLDPNGETVLTGTNSDISTGQWGFSTRPYSASGDMLRFNLLIVRNYVTPEPTITFGDLLSVGNTIGNEESFNASWILNVTSSTEESYYIDVFFNSSYGSDNVPNNDTENRLIYLNPSLVGECWSIIGNVLFRPQGCVQFTEKGENYLI